MRFRGVILVVCGLLAGCAASKDRAPQAASPEDRTFEDAREPAVSAQTHFAAGQFAETQGNIPKAIEQYRAAARVKPDHQPSLYRLGVLCTQAKLFPDAVAAWNAYIKATNGNPVGYSNLGFTCQLSGDLAAAEQAYKAGIAKDPKSRPCRVNYGLMLARDGKFDSAIAQWQAVLTPAEVHYNLAGVHESRGEKAQAKAEYRQAIQLDPTMRDAKLKLAALDKD